MGKGRRREWLRYWGPAGSRRYEMARAPAALVVEGATLKGGATALRAITPMKSQM